MSGFEKLVHEIHCNGVPQKVLAVSLLLRSGIRVKPMSFRIHDRQPVLMKFQPATGQQNTASSCDKTQRAGRQAVAIGDCIWASIAGPPHESARRRHIFALTFFMLATALVVAAPQGQPMARFVQ